MKPTLFAVCFLFLTTTVAVMAQTEPIVSVEMKDGFYLPAPATSPKVGDLMVEVGAMGTRKFYGAQCVDFIQFERIFPPLCERISDLTYCF